MIVLKESISPLHFFQKAHLFNTLGLQYTGLPPIQTQTLVVSFPPWMICSFFFFFSLFFSFSFFFFFFILLSVSLSQRWQINSLEKFFAFCLFFTHFSYSFCILYFWKELQLVCICNRSPLLNYHLNLCLMGNGQRHVVYLLSELMLCWYSDGKY